MELLFQLGVTNLIETNINSLCKHNVRCVLSPNRVVQSVGEGAPDESVRRCGAKVLVAERRIGVVRLSRLPELDVACAINTGS